MYFGNKKKYFNIILICSIISISAPTQSAYAGAWGEALTATGIKQAMEVATREINNVLTSTLKTVAISVLMRQVNQAIGQKSTFITNWEDYLFAAPAAAGVVYANDLITRMTLNRASTRYEGKGESTAAGVATFEERIARASTAALQSMGNEKKISLPDYVQGANGTVNPDTGKMRVFDMENLNPNFSGYADLYFNPINNPSMAAGYVVSQAEQKAEQIRISKQEKQKDAGYETPDNVSPGAIADIKRDINSTLLGRIREADNPIEAAEAMAQQVETNFLEGAEKSLTNRMHLTSNEVIKSLNAEGGYKIY